MNKKGGYGMRSQVNSNDFKGVFKDKDKSTPSGKPERYNRDSFVKELIGKVLKIILVNGEEIQGRLVELGMFDICIQTSQARLIVLKSAIIAVEVIS